MYQLVCQDTDKKADIYVHQSSTGVNRQPRRVPKQQETSQQVNRQRRNSGSLASSSIASSQRPVLKKSSDFFPDFFFKFPKLFWKYFFRIFILGKFYREKKIKTNASQSFGENEIVVAWSTRLMSLKKSSDLTLFVRTNREVDETIVVNWSAEIATQWSSYENLKGTIEIPIGTDHGTFKITSENIQGRFQNVIIRTKVYGHS